MNTPITLRPFLRVVLTVTVIPAVLLFAAVSTCAQEPQRSEKQGSGSLPTSPALFDVASVKPSDPKHSGFTVRPNPSNFTISGASLKYLIEYAYNLHDFQIESGPEWTNSARFDIVAKMDDPSMAESHEPAAPQDWEASQNLLRARLQFLLADRFKLRVHKGTKELPIYTLLVVKGGPKLQASKVNTGYSSGPGQLRCSDSTMDALASMLSDMVNRIVLDQTKLTGGYVFTLKWTPDDSLSTNAVLPGLFTALQEQLGLKLASSKGPVETLVIDRVEMPSEN